MNYQKISFVFVLVLLSSCSRQDSNIIENTSNASSSANKFKYEETYDYGELKLFKSSNLPVTGFVQSFDSEKGYLSNESYYINGIKNGLSTSYYEDGKESRSEYYLNGQLNGLSEVWHANGRKSSEGSYINGEPDGKQVAWYEDGKLNAIHNYKNGRLIGWQRSFNEDGTLLYETNLKNGNGKIAYKIPNTEIEILKNYVNGEIVFPENGTSNEGFIEYTYLNGEIVRIKIEQNKVVTQEQEWTFKNSLLNGEHKNYYASGKIEEQANYINGLENGIWQTWYENGTLKSLEKFDYGLSISKKCWDENGKEIECK
jgi:antitoxin component YwqK of YwqJK toxin-antitoxin module